MYSERTLNFQIGKMKFSFNDLKLSFGDSTNNMTQKEAELLLFLCEHPNRILKREEVLLHVWGKDDYFLGRSMDVYISKLRKYLSADDSVEIENHHGVGFKLLEKV